MYDRWSSSSMGCRDTRPRGSWASSGMAHLDVQVHDFFRVVLDVLAAWLAGLSHKDREERVCGDSVLDRHLFQDTACWVHGGLPEFLRVHLAEPLVSLVDHALVSKLSRKFFPLLLRVRVECILALLDFVEGWLGDVHVPCVDYGSHVAEEEREEEGRNVLAVHIGVTIVATDSSK